MIEFHYSIPELDHLREWSKQLPDIFEKVMTKALSDSIAMVETNIKKRTPVDTGLLQGSIGSATYGIKFVKGLNAGVGTNIRYAAAVNDVTGRYHKNGEDHFMEKGGTATRDYIQERMGKALEELANSAK